MTAHGGPLRGVRVVELASIGPGPHAAMTLADLGADVIRVERPEGTLSAVARDKDVLTRGRPSVAMDLKDPRAASVVLDLVASADVLIEGMRPGVAERLGVGPAECLARNPRLVYGRMTGWGQEGPLAPRAGHDIDYIAVSGSLHGLGRAGGPPQFPQNLLGDFAGGSAYLVIGVLAALLEARTSGQGQVVDAAIVDGAAHLNAMLAGLIAGGAWREERGHNLLDSGAPFYDVYETVDGRHMAVGAIEPQFYAELLEGLGLVETAPDRSDPGNWAALREAIAARFRQRTQQEWTGVFEGTDACVSPVLPLTEASRHPHLAARHTYVDRGGVVQPAP
ncbi:MAG TPA: CaiB/BaiF CoA-transferase family protein, partial [Pedococcus sp.]|nr:CaiB/BaiF CoA-transferase family protein [Pedococcus sp.]